MLSDEEILCKYIKTICFIILDGIFFTAIDLFITIIINHLFNVNIVLMQSIIIFIFILYDYYKNRKEENLKLDIFSQELDQHFMILKQDNTF